MAQRKCVCHCSTKTGGGIVFPGRYLQVTVEPHILITLTLMALNYGQNIFHSTLPCQREIDIWDINCLQFIILSY